MPTLNIQYSITGLGSPISKTKSVTDEGDVTLEVAVADGQTNKLVACELDVSQCKALVLMATVAMTLKTNSSGSPADTIALSANVPLVYSGDAAETNPLGTDVTALYLTNASGTDGTFHMKAIFDATV